MYLITIQESYKSSPIGLNSNDPLQYNKNTNVLHTPLQPPLHWCERKPLLASMGSNSYHHCETAAPTLLKVVTLRSKHIPIYASQLGAAPTIDFQTVDLQKPKLCDCGGGHSWREACGDSITEDMPSVTTPAHDRPIVRKYTDHKGFLHAPGELHVRS